MKKSTISYFIFPIIAGLALAHPFSASAADDNPNDKKEQKAGPAAAAKAPHAAVAHAPAIHAAAAPKVAAQHQQVNKAAAPAVDHTAANPAVAKRAVANRSAAAPAPQSQVVQQSNTRNVRNTNATTNQTRVAAAPNGGNGGGQYTRANNYGGRWTAGNNHTDWNQGQEHDWDGHHYRWYDGGWMMIDGGFWPVPGGYQGGGSMMAGAQQQLANAGYYNGPIDGVPGPGTRQAIANYQNDNGLPATGHLNPPTRQALGLD